MQHALTGARWREPRRLHRLTLVLDPRFPGGTAAAVAAELEALRGNAELRVALLRTAMFAGRPVNPRLGAALEALGLKLDWEPAVVRGDTVVVHNPACLKFEAALPCRISCTTLYAVAHEGFLRPGGAEAFDVAACLDLLRGASVAARRIVAPVSPQNRRGVERWLAGHAPEGWDLAPFDWFNVCDFEMLPPVARPRDRRGRHSRPGPEKFPPLAVMRRLFPEHAERNVLLGADLFLADPAGPPPHWRALPFGAMDAGRFLREIDFFVYFTHPLWRDSFGRAVAEAVAAGKLVLTDPGTAGIFGPGVVGCLPEEVDGHIARFIAEPALYGRAVRAAQRGLARRSPQAFRAQVLRAATGEGAPGVAVRPPEARAHAPV